MVVGTGPTALPAWPAAVNAARLVRHPVPALQAPVFGLGQSVGSATSQALNSHHPPVPQESMWLWMGSGTTPTVCPDGVFSPTGVRSRNIGWLGQVRVRVLSGHCAKLLAPRVGSKTLLD